MATCESLGGMLRPRSGSNQPMLISAVRDQGTNGKGITREQASQLFPHFGRLDTHAQIAGSGLGLLSVRRIVAAHGGEVYVEGYADGSPNSKSF